MVTTCAVHLYSVGDLSTNSFLLALIRFIARRGKPKTHCTNNGKNFKDAKRELSILLKDLNQTKIENSLINKGVTWKFNHPSMDGGLLGVNLQIGGCFHRELKQFKFNYMFCDSFVICYCRIVNIDNCTFIAS